MKKLFLISALLLLPTMLQAQQLQPINSVEWSLKLTPAEAEVVWKALRKLPVEEVDALMQKLQRQVVEQTTPKEQEKK